MPDLPIIAVVGGSGAEGKGLAVRWAKAGYKVLIGSRATERAKSAASELNALLGSDLVSGMSNSDAAGQAAIVVMTVPYSAQLTTLAELKGELENKILVDVTVPLVPPKVSRVQLPTGSSAVAIAQSEMGAGVRVVAAFQNVSAHHLMDLDHHVECDVLVCGDDENAREEVVKLANSIGLRGLHAGPLVNSAAAEALTSILIFMNRRYKSTGAGIQITGLPAAH